MYKKSLLAAGALFGASMAFSAPQASADDLVLYCSVQIEWCQVMVEEFEKETGISVAMQRKSSGETLAQMTAESRNPQGDVWWGGTGDPHLQAAEEGLTAEYVSPNASQLADFALNQAAAANNRTVGIYTGALGIGYNSELLAEKGLPAPTTWSDLADPAYAGEIQMANPNSSGTAYTTLATLVQILGEDAAFELMIAWNPNMNEYTKSGSAPIKAAARGETTIGIVFQHDMVTQVVDGFPIVIVSPTEGTGFEVGSMSIIEGGPNPESARTFYDWALEAETQELAEGAKAFQVPSNASASPPEAAPDLSQINLIDYDFVTYGSADTRTRLLQRWDDEVGSLPR